MSNPSVLKMAVLGPVYNSTDIMNMWKRCR